MDSERGLMLEFRQALDEVLPPAPWLEAAVARDLRRRRAGNSLDRGLSKPKTRVAIATGLAIVLIAAVVAAALLKAAPYASVPVKNPPPPLETGNAIVPIQTAHFLNAQEGAVVTERGLLITHDGGEHWQLVLKLDWTSRHYITLIDAEHIIIVSWSKTGTLVLSSTADGGANWHMNPIAPIDAPSPAYLPYTFFLNAREGWQQTASGDVFHTSDAGAHWARLWRSGGSTQQPSGLFFTDSTHGYMGAYGPDGGAGLYVTRDGGRTWKLARLTPPPGGWGPGCCPKGFITWPKVTMFGNRGFVVESDGPRAAVYTTSDGGQSWGSPLLLPAGTIAVRFLDPVNWWAADNATLNQTVDAGATWRPVPLKLPAGGYVSLDGLSTADSQILWGVLYSFDQGVPLSSCDQTGFTNCEFPIRSTDGGAHWAIVKLPAP